MIERVDLPENEEDAEPSAEPSAESVDGEVAGGAGDADRPLTGRVEALLFASGQALNAGRIARALGVGSDAVGVALTELLARWQSRDCAFELVEIAGGFRFMTRPDYHQDVAALRGAPGPERLSPAALETLAVVAYRQPITRAAVEAVRGVQAGPVLRLLIEHDLVRIAGRSDEPGHPLLYGTTRRFLDHFGLASLDKLPDLKDVLESS